MQAVPSSFPEEDPQKVAQHYENTLHAVVQDLSCAVAAAAAAPAAAIASDLASTAHAKCDTATGRLTNQGRKPHKWPLRPMHAEHRLQLHRPNTSTQEFGVLTHCTTALLPSSRQSIAPYHQQQHLQERAAKRHPPSHCAQAAVGHNQNSGTDT